MKPSSLDTGFAKTMSTTTTPSLPAAAVPGRQTLPAWWQAAPFTLVFALFFIIPLALIVMVSFWDFWRWRWRGALAALALLAAARLSCCRGSRYDYMCIFDGCVTCQTACASRSKRSTPRSSSACWYG